jgi:sulfoxide reductase heme-binding subunit YedZ
LLAILHFFWMRAGKRNFGEVAVYATIVAVLLGWRLYKATRGTGYFMKLGSHSAKG